MKLCRTRGIRDTFAGIGGKSDRTMKPSPSSTNLLASVMFALIMLGGCAVIPPASSPVTTKRVQMHMGTLVTVTAIGSDTHAGHRAVQAAFDEIKRLEQLLSTWRPDSELSQVNTEAGRQPVKVSRETFEVVERSLEMARLTHGGFNIALGPAIEAWSVTERQQIPDEPVLERLKLIVDWTRIQIDKKAQTIYLPQKGMHIDVGGIGKGYAADLAVGEMKRVGAMGGVVALSGDIKTFGVLPDGQGFPVGIKHPRQDDAVVAIIDLNDEAISTAGDYERFFERDGIRYHHILDPHTLQPARGCQSVTVLAKEGIMADGLDTAIFVLGPEKGMELVERLPGIEAIMIDREGKMAVSSGLRHRLRLP